MSKPTIWARSPNSKHLISIDGDVYATGERKGIVNPTITNWGYHRFTAYIKGKFKGQRVHRLVMIVFSPIDKMDNMQVNHKDSNKLNNTLENLEWASSSRNVAHAWANGAMPRTQRGKHSLHALSGKQMKEAIQLRADGMSYPKIAKLYGCSNTTIRRICLKEFAYE